jgi:hypothetical protein
MILSMAILMADSSPLSVPRLERNSIPTSSGR